VRQITVEIDGRKWSGPHGVTVLEAAAELGITIPTLCHHPGLGPYGACRLCLVEVRAGPKAGLAVSCTLPVAEGMVIATRTGVVRRARKFVLELLAARPGCREAVARLAAEWGMDVEGRFARDGATPGPAGCVLCGRCVRACARVGAHAVAFAGRGVGRHVTPPFGRPPESCAGCGACAFVCPTGAAALNLTAAGVALPAWQAEVEWVRCAACGAPAGPPAPVELPHGRGALCPRCRRRASVEGIWGG